MTICRGLLLVLLAAAAGCTAQGPPADLILANAHIWTGDAAYPEADALAVRDGRIIAIGDTARVMAARGPATRVVDARGHRVVPGFNDAHWHLPTRRSADLGGSGTVEELLRRLVDFSRTAGPDEWIVGRGWGPSDFPGQQPHRRYLDEALPSRAVVLTDRDGHQSLASTEALARAGITRRTPAPPGGRIVRDRNGDPTGVLQEGAAMSLVSRLIPPLPPDQVHTALLEQLRIAASFGLTSLQVAGASGSSGAEFDAYQRALREQALTQRVRVAVPVMRDVTAAQMARFVALRDEHRGQLLSFGIAKGMVDGTVDARTAAMLSPYTGGADAGLPLWQAEELNRTVALYDKAGLQVQLHAIGDRAIRLALDAYAHAARVNGTSGRRHRVEHAEVPAPEDVPRFAALGVIASTQAMFASPDAITLTSYAPALGPIRASRANAFRRFDDAGAVQAFGSDYPVFTMEVMRGIHAAVTRQLPDGSPPGGWFPEQRLSVEAAVRHFTRDAAFASAEDTDKGTLTSGRLADFVVLSADIFSIPPAELASVKALLTVMGGRVTWRGEGWRD